MRKLFWTNSPIMHTSLLYAIGILCAATIPINLEVLLGVCLVGLLCCGISMHVEKTKYFFASCCMVTFFLLGCAMAKLAHPKKQVANLSSIIQKPAILTGTVLSVSQQSTFNKITVDLSSIETDTFITTSPSAKANLYQYDKIQVPLVGSKIRFTSILRPFRPPAHKFQFNNLAYQQKKQIYFSGTLNTWTLLDSPSWISLKRQEVLRLFESKIDAFLTNENSKNVFKAMVLGKSLSYENEVQQQFIKAGAAHFLAISGLHIGLVILFFKTLLRPFCISPNAKKRATFLALLVGWCYIILVGTPISAVRTGVMCTLYVLTLFIKRSPNNLNTIFLAFFLFLLYNPNLIYDIGFQLSFAAVIGIVSSMPTLQYLTRNLCPFVRPAISIIGISIVAQIAVTPILYFHFNEFQVYSILSSSIGSVLATISLYSGILFLIICSASDTLAAWLGPYVDMAFNLFSYSTKAIANLPNPTLHFARPSATSFFSLLAFVFCSLLSIPFKDKKTALLGLSCFIFFTINMYQTKPFAYNAYYFYPLSRGHLVDRVENKALIRFESGVQEKDKEMMVSPFVIGNNLAIKSTVKLDKNQIGWQGKTTTFVFYSDSLSVKDQQIDFLLLGARPKLKHFETFIKKNKVSTIVFNSKTTKDKIAKSLNELDPSTYTIVDMKGKVTAIPIQKDEIIAAY